MRSKVFSVSYTRVGKCSTLTKSALQCLQRHCFTSILLTASLSYKLTSSAYLCHQRVSAVLEPRSFLMPPMGVSGALTQVWRLKVITEPWRLFSAINCNTDQSITAKKVKTETFHSIPIHEKQQNTAKKFTLRPTENIITLGYTLYIRGHSRVTSMCHN